MARRAQTQPIHRRRLDRLPLDRSLPSARATRHELAALARAASHVSSPSMSSHERARDRRRRRRDRRHRTADDDDGSREPVEDGSQRVRRTSRAGRRHRGALESGTRPIGARAPDADATRRDATRPLPIFTERRKHSIAVNQSIAITPRCVLLAPSIVRSRRLPRLARSRARSPSSGALSRARVPRRPTVPPSRRLDRPRHGTEASIDRGLDEGSRSVTLVQYGTYMGYESASHRTPDTHATRDRSFTGDDRPTEAFVVDRRHTTVVTRRSSVTGRE